MGFNLRAMAGLRSLIMTGTFLSLFAWIRPAFGAVAAVMNPADTAWVLVSAALVMVMPPGLALFYGGWFGAKMY